MNPGSKEAIAQGCACPIIDNHYGKGFPRGGKVVFWISELCPIHSKGAKNDTQNEPCRNDGVVVGEGREGA